jgi:hypothetical protein
MKKIALLASILVLTFALTADDKKADDKSVTLSGEVVDMHCYITRNAKGTEHAGCSNACLSRDVPAGFLTDDGTLYLLVNEKPVSVKDKVAGMAGKKVKAHGKLVERNGVKALQLASIEE